MVGGAPFNLEESISHGEKFMDHAMVVIKYVMDTYPLAQKIPRALDYALGMLIRNLLIWFLFRCTHPHEIEVDFLDLLMTKGSFGLLSTYVCPCGGTLLNFHHHWVSMRRNNAQDSEHVWVLKTYSDFSYAVKGKKYDKDNSMFFGTTFVHKIDEYFQQAWMENVIPELVDDVDRMEKLKKLFIYSKCVY